MKTYTWVLTLTNSPSATRKKVKKAIFEGMKYFNAKFKKIGPKESHKNVLSELEGDTEYSVKSYDPDVMAFIKQLEKEQGFEFIGFSDQITYIKESGSKDQLEALWEHPFGSPTLLYKIKGLPALIIAGPDIEFNDSIRNKIPSNNREKTYGVTG